MELRSIYRTYRPQKWADVVGQELIVRTLTNEIAHDTLVHAYLFTGTRGVGKTTTARLLAKSVNCETRKKSDAEPCNTCAACVAITEGRSLDVMEIDAASHTGVDNVRENIIAASRVAPLERRTKVFIIDEVHMLSTPAFNALLKTLEEPSSNVLFILATTESDRLPDTIISRCQRFDFRRITEKEMQKRLAMLAKAEGVSVAEEILGAIIRAAGGSLRDAESMVGQLVGLGKRKITAEEAGFILPHGDTVKAKEFVTMLLTHAVSSALTLVDAVMDRGGDVSVFLRECSEIVRAQLLAGIRNHDGARGEDASTPNTLAALLRRLLDADRDAAMMDPPQLALELLVADYADGAESRNQEITKSSNHQSAKSPEHEIKETKKEENREVRKEQDAHSPPQSLTLLMVHERWKDVVAASKKHNHSLALILKVATPVAIDDRVLTLGFRYSFHADRLDDLATKVIARRILEEVFLCPLDVRATIVQAEKEAHDGVAENPLTKSAPQATFLNDILTTFGGKVVKKGESAL